jgi:hypothetical protein
MLKISCYNPFKYGKRNQIEIKWKAVSDPSKQISAWLSAPVNIFLQLLEPS